MAMSRQKKLDKMDVIELAAEKPSRNSALRKPAPGRYIFEAKDLVIGYDEPLSHPRTLPWREVRKLP